MRANVFVGAFAEYVYTYADVTRDVAEMREGLRLSLLKPTQGSSSLYSAILQNSRKLLAAQSRRKILVVTSDGVDNTSAPWDRDTKEIARALMQDGTVLYAIVLQDSSAIRRPSPRAARA